MASPALVSGVEGVGPGEVMTQRHSWQGLAGEQAYGRELQEAWECTEKYKRTRKETELHQAWDQYYHVFRRINKQLPTLTVLELQYVAPALVRAQACPPDTK